MQSLTDKDKKFIAQQKKIGPGMYWFCGICLFISLMVLLNVGLFSDDLQIRSLGFSGAYYCFVSTIFVYKMEKKDKQFLRIIEKMGAGE